MNFLLVFKKWASALFLLFFLNQGCQQGKAPEKGLYTEVMGVHDSVMPKMKDLRKGVQYAEEKLEKGDLTAAEKTELVALKRSMMEAEDAMWEWMHAFNSERAQSDTATAYLRDEKVKIKNVSAMMLGSLEELEAFRKKMEVKSKNDTQ